MKKVVILRKQAVTKRLRF